MHLTHRQTCRVCGSPALTPVIDLGPQHLQGSFVKLGREMPPNRRIPCQLVRCDPSQDESSCGLLQMRHTVPPEILYSNYWYASGTNQTMRDHLEGIALEARMLAGNESPVKSRVLDIGCNDLTLLGHFPVGSWERVGIDPSAKPRNDDEFKVFDCLFQGPLDPNTDRFDVITSIAMFYDLEDPVEFARAVRQILKPLGVWIFEVAYLPAMLANNSYDTICHEHLEYYSLAVLEKIMALAGLSVFRAELNDCNGGSIRCYVFDQNSRRALPASYATELRRLREAEFDLALDTDQPYLSFQSRIANHREKLMGLLREIKKRGESIHILGASTKGNTLLQFCGIDSRLIDCAADRNPEKHQAMTLGSCIQIVCEEESRKRKPDWYLVLPWHFRKELLEREQYEFHKLGQKTPGFIFPLPEIEVRGPL